MAVQRSPKVAPNLPKAKSKLSKDVASGGRSFWKTGVTCKKNGAAVSVAVQGDFV